MPHTQQDGLVVGKVTDHRFEKAAKAPASMGTESKPIAHWYAVDAHGAATLCTCEEDARETAAESAQMFPNCAPYTAVQLAPVSAPTSHPIPTGATGERDWELACDQCNGSGHVFVKHQVAERKTDVQEFKEECVACEGRGFNIAFEDIPGIAEYVKSCRAAPAAGDALGDPALQKLFGEAITGALGFGAQGVNPPPVGHWLEPFWNMARADAALAARLALLDHPLLRDVLGYVEDAGPADVWGAAQSWMSLRDAAIAQQSQRKEA